MRDFTVLGLVGPAGSGKDLVADWFTKKGFVKVAFADPMKRFVKNTFPTVTVEQLWGPSEERNREFDVSEMWWFEAIARLEDGAKEIVQHVLEDGNRVTGFVSLHEWFTWLRKNYPNKLSARVILQTLGTEWGRNVDPLLWIKYAHKVAGLLRGDDNTGGLYRYDRNYGLYPDEGNPIGVIIPDHRFKNEIEYTQAQNGYAIRLRRVAHEGGEGNVGIQGHASETEMRGIPFDAFDFILELQEGIDKVHWALESIYKDKSWETKRLANSQVRS